MRYLSLDYANDLLKSPSTSIRSSYYYQVLSGIHSLSRSTSTSSTGSSSSDDDSIHPDKMIVITRLLSDWISTIYDITCNLGPTTTLITTSTSNSNTTPIGYQCNLFKVLLQDIYNSGLLTMHRYNYFASLFVTVIVQCLETMKEEILDILHTKTERDGNSKGVPEYILSLVQSKSEVELENYLIPDESESEERECIRNGIHTWSEVRCRSSRGRGYGWIVESEHTTYLSSYYTYLRDIHGDSAGVRKLVDNLKPYMIERDIDSEIVERVIYEDYFQLLGTLLMISEDALYVIHTFSR